jgi:hypothetical protein
VEFKSNTIVDKFEKHGSFLILVFGAIFYLTSIFVAKKHLAPEQYGLYSLILFILTMSSSFGCLGSEQVFMRLSSLSGGRILVNKLITVIPIILAFVFSVFLAYYYYYTSGLSFIFVFITGVSQSVLMFYYNVLRIKSWFKLSQLINVIPKLCVLLLTSLMYLNIIDFMFFLKFLSLLLMLLTVVITFFIFKIKFSFEIKLKRNDFLFFPSYFLSLLTLFFVSNFDKLIINNSKNIILFGEYFFIFSVALQPFLLIHSYLGFKSIVFFKKNKSFNLSQSIKKSLMISILSFFYLGTIFLFKDMLALDKLNLFCCVIIFIMIFVRGIYSYLSAALGAFGKSMEIVKPNIVTLLCLLIIWIFFHFSFVEISIKNLLTASCFIWLVRSTAYYRGVINSEA